MGSTFAQVRLVWSGTSTFDSPWSRVGQGDGKNYPYWILDILLPKFPCIRRGLMQHVSWWGKVRHALRHGKPRWVLRNPDNWGAAGLSGLCFSSACQVGSWGARSWAVRIQRSSLKSGASLDQAVSSWCFHFRQPWHLMKTNLLNGIDRHAFVEWFKKYCAQRHGK